MGGTSVTPEAKRTIRTAVQALIGVVPLFPVLVPALGLSESAGLGAALVAVSAGVARLMAVPQVDAWVDNLLGKK